MDTKDIIDKLNGLIQLDFDAIQAYESAIKRIDIEAINNELEQFKRDHERHILDLSEVVRGLGGEPLSPGRDLKGVLLETMTALRSVLGTTQALKAMRTGEQLTNRQYDEAVRLDLPRHVQAIVARNREDERRHLEYIEGAIKQLESESGRGTDRPGGSRPTL